MVIWVEFSWLPDSIIIDSTYNTTLTEEYLLNDFGNLEIHKKYSWIGVKCSTYLFARHPANSNFIETLLEKKITELKKYIEDNAIHCENRSTSAILRKSIRDSLGSIEFRSILIPIDKEDSKKIWEQIEKYLPLFVLFQSDRQNKDQDSEVQDPMKLAIKEILKDPVIQWQLMEIAIKVEEKVKTIADMTKEKLNEMNPELANILKPILPQSQDIKWESAFGKVWVECDDWIPLNKRWSWVRRLVLLNFFRAQAERRKTEKWSSNIIYAIEEPETSQHPDHQKKLINAFIELSETGSSQIILTTHSPAISQLLPINSLCFIEKDSTGNVCITNMRNDWNTEVLLKIVESLWIMPTLSKIVCCVEGENDRNFLLAINKSIPELKNILDLSNDHISIISMWWSTLKRWVERHYLKNAWVIEFHLYDRDPDNQYGWQIDIVNARGSKDSWRLTMKMEMENYIHPDLIEADEYFSNLSLNRTDYDNLDVTMSIANQKFADFTSKTPEERKNIENKIKQILNSKIAGKITKEHLVELQAWDEVYKWFYDLRSLLWDTISITE